MESKMLKELLSDSKLISQQLAHVKEDVIKGATFADNPQKYPSEYFEDAINLRFAFRSLADGIQAKRMLAQLQKQKIQRGKIYLQGLQYYKTTLQAKIAESEIEVLDLKEYLEEPLGEISWAEGYTEGQAKIRHQLEKKKAKKGLFEEKVKEKLKRQEQFKQKSQIYEKIMPSHARKLQEQILETAKMFNVSDVQKPDKIQCKELAGVYEMFSSLKNKKHVQITYTREQFEEIEIVIHKSDHKLYKQASSNKIHVEEQNIKFVVASLKPNFSKLVIGVDRRQDFTTEQVFSRLIYNEKVKDVFSCPANQFERNINNKYVHIDWVESMLACRVLDGQGLVDMIRERVFCLQMVKSILQNMKKLSFFFPLAAENESSSVSINPKQQAIELILRVNVTSCEKINFDEYLDLAHIPDWVRKYLTTFSLLQLESRQKSLEHQMNNQIDRRSIDQILTILELQELEDKGLNSYYKISLNINPLVAVFVIILPFNYPKVPSKLKLIECCTKQDRQFISQTGFEDVPCKLKRSEESKRVFTDQMSHIQKSVNEGIVDFMKGQSFASFRLLLQINRLICLLAEVIGDKKK